MIYRSMMTSSNGNIFRATGHLCEEFTGPRWIPLTKASAAEFWCFLWSLNKRLSKQSWGWWFGTLSCPLWRHCNAVSDHLHWKPWVPLMPTLSSIRCHQWRQSWHYENLLFFSVKVHWWSNSIHPFFLGTCTWMANVHQSLTKHNNKWNKHRITKSAIKDTGFNYIM